MPRYIRLIFPLFLLSATACVSSPPGVKELRKLCEKDYGITVNEKVEAKGYLDATTGMSPHYVDDIIDIGFDFVEYCYDKPTRTTVTQEAGCWQVYKAKQGSAQCDAYLNKGINTWVVEPYVTWRKDYCFAVKQIDKPTAKIGLYSEYYPEFKSDKKYRITKSVYYSLLLENKKELARTVSYSRIGLYASAIQYGCNSPEITGKDLSIHRPNYYRTFFNEFIKLN